PPAPTAAPGYPAAAYPAPTYRAPPPYQPARAPGAPLTITPEVDEPLTDGPEPYPQSYPAPPPYGVPPATIPAQPSAPIESVPLGPSREPGLSSHISIAPAATLACPLGSALGNWMATGVPPAARRWFGPPV